MTMKTMSALLTFNFFHFSLLDQSKIISTVNDFLNNPLNFNFKKK